MKLCLIQIFFTVTASLGLNSNDDDNVNGLTIILTVWLLVTPCLAPFLDLLSEMDVEAVKEKLIRAAFHAGPRSSKVGA